METTPEIDATLNELTNLCCEALFNDAILDPKRVEALARNLSTNGWERHTAGAPPLAIILKNRIKEQCRESAMHRGAEIDGIVAKVQSAYTKAYRSQCSTPDDDNHSSPMPPRTIA